MDRKTELVGNDLRCLKGAPKIAGVKYLNASVGQTVGQRVCLSKAALCKRTVEMPLLPFDQIPLRLAMADGKKHGWW